MFIAMNRFKVIKEERKAFEELWVTRQSHLDEVKGFRVFHLLRGPEREDHVLYSSQAVKLVQVAEWTSLERTVSCGRANERTTSRFIKFAESHCWTL
jgi:heme-degrading monooxygenase HmoA